MSDCIAYYVCLEIPNAFYYDEVESMFRQYVAAGKSRYMDDRFEPDRIALCDKCAPQPSIPAIEERLIEMCVPFDRDAQTAFVYRRRFRPAVDMSSDAVCRVLSDSQFCLTFDDLTEVCPTAQDVENMILRSMSLKSSGIPPLELWCMR